MYAISSLLDPMSCGEDLSHNAARFIELAPSHCSGCADYHIRSAVHRLAGPPKGIAFDRPQLIALIGKIIRDASLRLDRKIEIVIAGSADTAVLATCAHAAATHGGEAMLERCRFTLLDRCETPLIVCAEFASRHGLDFHAEQSDLLSAGKPCDADLIVAHSIFRFIARDDQAALLMRLGIWLAPNGRLILSNRILLDDAKAEAEAELRKRAAADKAVADLLAKGTLRISIPAEELLQRLARAKPDSRGRPGEFRSLAEVQALIRQSQLEEILAESLNFEFRIAPGDVMERRRVLAVLARAKARRR